MTDSIKKANNAQLSDSDEFMADYQRDLDKSIAEDGLPGWVYETYQFDSCLKHREDKQVYLVTDRRTGSPAILRLMKVDKSSGPNRQKHDQEYAILSRLDHPGIPKVYGNFVEDGRSFLVREYFPGQPLDKVLAQGPLAVDVMRAYLLDLCTILGYLHQQTPPVVHRDIKPGNIIVMPNGRIGLTDFGIAREYKADSDSDTSYEGTCFYAPPEQFGYSQSTPLSDIYALGIVMLCMVTGSPVRQGIDERINDRQLKAIIERMIAFDPKDRFQSVDELKERLTKTRFNNTSPVIFNQSFFRSRKKLVQLLLALAIVTGIGLGWYGLSKYMTIYGSTGKLDDESGAIDNTPSGNWRIDADQDIKLLINPDNVGSPSNPTIAQDYRLGDALYDSDSLGNLGGNIVNGGMAVESPDALYVASDIGVLRLSLQGEFVSLVIEVDSPHSLNYHRGSLYFASSQGIYLYRPDTDQCYLLSDAQAAGLYFIDGKCYFDNIDDQLRLYELTFETNEDQADEAYITQSQVALVSLSQGQYRNITSDLQVYTTSDEGSRIVWGGIYDSESTVRRVIKDVGDSKWLSVLDDIVYFYDVKTNALAGCNLNGADNTALAEGSCSHIIACPYGVFYISPVTGQLTVYKFSDKTQKTVVSYGVDSYSLAGEWVFYKTAGENPELHMVRFDGSGDHLVPHP
ncbi:MAG: protein kinase [Coriobacteriia bacterium]|nr:protein kinase [Coriobacteriia bacterium]